MAHSLSPVTKKDVPQILSAHTLKVSWVVRFVLIVFVVIGVLAFAQGAAGEDPRRAWTALHVNFVYWFLVAASCTTFAAVFHICNAEWVRPLKRLFEASSPFFLYSLIPLVALFFGREFLFVWATEHIHGKGPWLEPHFVYIRDFIAIFALAFLARKIVFHSLRRDVAAIHGGLVDIKKEEANEQWSSGILKKIRSSLSGNAVADIDESTLRMTRLSPLMIIFFALIMTLIAFDQLMSVDPHWYSTLFGGFYFMSGAYVAVAWVAIWLVVARSLNPLFKAKVERRTLHDLGKLVFGFGIFWAYLFWSHYLPIWYGNLPEETAWLILRLREQPWHDFAWVILASCFIIPFLLGLSRDVKQVPALLFATALFVIVGIWLQQYLLFAPTHYRNHIPLCWSDMLITLGFLGAYALSVLSFLSKVPLMPFGDFFKTPEPDPTE